MTRHSTLRLRLAPAALAALATAPWLGADLLTVGPAGADFREIQDAIDAARDGDVILVQPSTYAGIAVTKPVRILGDGTGEVLIDAALAAGVSIGDIGSGEELVLSGVRVQGSPGPSGGAIEVSDCAGTVVLHDVGIHPVSPQDGLRLSECDRVLLLDSVVHAGEVGAAAVEATSSTLWIADSEVVGLSPADGLHELLPGARAVEVQGSALHVWRSTLVGGDGNSVQAEAFGAPSVGGAGIAADASSLVLYGGQEGQVRGGDGGAAPFFGQVYDGAAGVSLSGGSSARIQADLPVAGGLQGGQGVQAPAVEADATSTFASDATVFPTLAVEPEQLVTGGNVHVALEGSASAFQFLFFALGTGPDLVLPGVEGIFALDLGFFQLLQVVALPPEGATSLSIPVPANPALVGSTVFFQASESAGGQLAISNPGLATIAD